MRNNTFPAARHRAGRAEEDGPHRNNRRTSLLQALQAHFPPLTPELQSEFDAWERVSQDDLPACETGSRRRESILQRNNTRLLHPNDKGEQNSERIRHPIVILPHPTAALPHPTTLLPHPTVILRHNNAHALRNHEITCLSLNIHILRRLL